MLALAALLSLLIGLVLGLLGGGGSMLTVPMLLYVLHVAPRSAIALSLLVIGATSAVGALLHARAGRLRLRTGLLFGAAGMVGAYAGGRVAHFLPPRLLLLLFALMMIATAIAMLRGRRGAAEEPVTPGGEVPVLRVLLQGTTIGALTGLVGAGGGFLVVPALTLLGGLAMGPAVGTSLLVIAMQSLAGFVSYVGHVPIDWSLAALVVGASVIGIVIGGRLADRVPQALLRKGFGWLVLGMAGFLIFKQLS